MGHSTSLTRGWSTAARLAYYTERGTIDECWLWQAGCEKFGYGKLRSEWGALAHQASYAEAHGPIAKGLCVLHRCDNPRCVNPHHLFLGTKTDNMSDKVAKDRQAKGEPHAWKLTERDVREIRTDPRILKAIAADYGINQSMVWAIKHRTVWRHVT